MAFNNELIDEDITSTNGGDWNRRITSDDRKRFYFFKNKRFQTRVFIENTATACLFENCHFENGVVFSKPNVSADILADKIFNCRIGLVDCKIEKQLVITDCTFEKKVRFHDCDIETFLPGNAIFKNLADFWSTSFRTSVTFYKTDFNATTVFSMVTFENNVLFTYSLLADKTIFSRTKFKKGVDFSQAIISGDLRFFDLNIRMFKSPYFHKDDKGYQKAIDHEGVIPLVNKQETFRLLKHYANSNGDGMSASRFKVFEYRSYNLLIWKQMWHRHRWISNLANIPMMLLNRVTNNYGSNYWLGVIFTICVAILFLNSMLGESLGYFYTWEYENWQWDKFTTLINPVHRITDLNVELTKRIYVLDFLSRITVGYGIYQTVQAFRKFK